MKTYARTLTVNLRTTLKVFGGVAALVVLTACGEKPQTATGVKSDAAPYAGTGVTVFTSSGWKAGDKTSWEQAIKARGQYGQNEYSRSANVAQPAAK